MKLQTYTDGGSRGNPGLSAIGVLVCNEKGEILVEHSEVLGEATNNIAEYRALIEGLRRAKELGGTELHCFLDSELVVKQLRGEYKLKNYPFAIPLGGKYAITQIGPMLFVGFSGWVLKQLIELYYLFSITDNRLAFRRWLRGLGIFAKND